MSNNRKKKPKGQTPKPKADSAASEILKRIQAAKPPHMNPPKSFGGNPKGNLRNVPRRSNGVVIVITLLSLFVLFGLVLYVLNLGQQVNRRVAAQHAADASAQAAAGWAARQMNTVARNNTAMAHYLGVVNVLDATPQAAEFTLIEHRAFRDRLRGQLAGSLGSTPARLYRELDDMLSGFLSEVNAEIADLQPVVDHFRAHPVEAMTHYDGPDGLGYLWRAMYAMDAMNQAVVENFGAVIQTGAVEGGREDIESGRPRDSAVVVLPLDPRIPHDRKTFWHFHEPVMRGMLSDDLDDRVDNRGPWDALYGWRDIVGYWEGGTFVPGVNSLAGNVQGQSVGLSRGPTNTGGGRVVGAEFVKVGYVTYGPHEWLVRRVGGYVGRNLQNTRLDWYLHRIADYKAAYLWPPLPPINFPQGNYTVIHNDAYGHHNNPNQSGIRDIITPDWRTDFNEAVEIANRDVDRIKETGFIVVEIKSRYAPDDPNFLSPGSWTTVDQAGMDSPRIAIVRGWQDPRQWGVQMTSQFVWRDDWSYEVFFDGTIGINPEYEQDPDGNRVPVPQTVYRVDHFVFLGVNIGDPAAITDPYEGFDPDDRDVPAPTDLIRDEASPHDDGARFEHMSFLAVVRRDDTPQTWPARFHGGRPYPNMVAIAQAKVFNNHSWDLWTAMWHGQLAPVDQFDAWIDRMNDPPGEGVEAAYVSDQEITELHDYLDSLRDLAPAMLGH